MENIVHKYIELNNSFKLKFVYHFGKGAGFYSEYNNMLLCMLLCLDKHIQFCLYSDDMLFSGVNGQGYNSIFTPFCKEFHSSFHHRNNQRVAFPPYAKKHFIETMLYKLYTKNYLTADFFNEARTTWFEKKIFNIPELGIKGNIVQALNICAKIAYNFNDEWNLIIKKYCQILNLPNSYIALQIRQGDKIRERELYTSNNYIEFLKERNDNKNLFILTDDYQIIKELEEEHPEYNIYTFADENDNGYKNDNYLNSNLNNIKLGTLKLLSSIEIMRKSDLFIGTLSANPGMFLGIIEPNKCIYIDSPEWRIL